MKKYLGKKAKTSPDPMQASRHKELGYRSKTVASFNDICKTASGYKCIYMKIKQRFRERERNMRNEHEEALMSLEGKRESTGKMDDE